MLSSITTTVYIIKIAIFLEELKSEFKPSED
ncbi:hypothetical protein GIHI108528_06630 [Gillisia hiemivivida]